MESKVTIIFVHSGNATPPMCMVDSVGIACRVAPNSNVLVLVNQQSISLLQDQLQSRNQIQPHNLKLLSIESLGDEGLSKNFLENAKADKDFREGFWLQTANRFMLIADLMVAFNLENCLHLENDNVLYFDPSSKLDIFRSYARFAIPFDRSRTIPGVVWYKDAQIAQEIARYIQNRSDEHDMDVIRQFCDLGQCDAKPLPTMSPLYAKGMGLSVKEYCSGYEEFGGIFDGAAIGQYLGGVDPRNIAGDTRFFINETSDLDLRKATLTWGLENQKRAPILKFYEEYVNVLTVHAHSKDSLGVSPFNCSHIKVEDDLITGERLQENASLTISSDEVSSFHGRENIRSNNYLEIPTKEKRKLFKKKKIEVAPDEHWVEGCKNAKSIFVYTHLLPYFKKYVLARLIEPFTLITHNSDYGATLEDLDLLNHPLLIKWFAQNCECSHEKLAALPIGLANRQWGEEKLSQLLMVARKYCKSKLLYSNFSSHTHQSRVGLQDVISSMNDVTQSKNLTYEQYLKELSIHKFCLCPRGNGIDTHRFWEAQYLDTIPIVLKADWTAAYSGLPILLVNEWSDLLKINFEEVYIRISTTNFDRANMNLSKYTRQF